MPFYLPIDDPPPLLPALADIFRLNEAIMAPKIRYRLNQEPNRNFGGRSIGGNTKHLTTRKQKGDKNAPCQKTHYH